MHFSSLLYTPTQKSDALLFALLRLKKAKVHEHRIRVVRIQNKKCAFLGENTFEKQEYFLVQK